jgi:hypothetical protein
MPVITCPHCAGSTMHGCASCRVGNQSGICQGCGGDGNVTIPSNATTCPHCAGSTMHGCASCRVGNQSGICKVCKGAGRVAPG